MKAKRFTEEQIIGILNEAEQTGNIREVCKRNNITETTFYRWRTKFGGMEVSDAPDGPRGGPVDLYDLDGGAKKASYASYPLTPVSFVAIYSKP